MEIGKEVNKEETEQQQEAWSWGVGTDCQLGTGKLQDEHPSPSLSSPGHVSTLACGSAHVIALTSGGKVPTWGRGTSGQLGHGEMANSFHPKPLKFLENLFDNSCLCWMESLGIQGAFLLVGMVHLVSLGTATIESTKAIWNRIYCQDEMKVVQIAAGAEHSAMVTVDGAIKTWGWGEHGQLGLGNTSDHTSPQTVNLEPNVQSEYAFWKVYCGNGFTFAIRSVSFIKSQSISRW